MYAKIKASMLENYTLECLEGIRISKVMGKWGIFSRHQKEEWFLSNTKPLLKEG